MATSAVVNAYADICQYLYTAQIAKDNAFNNGSLNNGRDVLLMVQNFALEYGINESKAGLLGVTENVYRLCGAKLNEAQEIYSSGSAGVVVSPTSGSGSYVPYPIAIVVQASQVGAQTLSALVPSDWIGLLLFTECTINQSILQINSQFTYSVITGQFNFSLYGYSPQTGDVFTCDAFKLA